MKPYQLFLIIAAVIIAPFGVSLVPHQAAFQGVASQSVFYGTGTTNTSSTVNTTSTQIVPPSWVNFARISNFSTTTVSCYLDGKTAVSSSVQTLAGLNIGLVSSTFSGETSVCFGPAAGCIPYQGAINCAASQKATVGVIYN